MFLANLQNGTNGLVIFFFVPVSRKRASFFNRFSGGPVFDCVGVT